MSILYQHPPRVGLNAMDHPRGVPQQHDVTAIALYRKILIHGPHHHTVGLGDDGIKGVVRNRSAAGDGRQPRPAPRP